MDRLLSMEMFVLMVEKGSLTAAAREARLSPAMIGKHLRFLEQRLGTRLLQRTTRRQSLTEAGAHFLAQAKQLLADIATAEAGVHSLQRVPRGLLRIHAPGTFGAQRLAPALADFLRTHEQIRVELTLNDRSPDLLQDGYDAAIHIGTLKDSSLIARPLEPYRMVLCAAPGYLAQRGAPKKPADLTRHNCLGFSYWDHPESWRLHDSHRTVAVRITGNFVVNHGFALRAAALAGLGLIMQPAALVDEDIAAGRLLRILPNYEPTARPMSLLYPNDRQMPPKLRAFVDFIVERFGPRRRTR